MEMRKITGIVGIALGLLIIIGSIVMFITATTTINYYLSPSGWVDRKMSEDAEEEYALATHRQLYSIIGLIIGVLITILGFYCYLTQRPQLQRGPPQRPY